MKILYIHQYFNSMDDIGGTRSYEFAKRFVKLGHEVDIITTYRYNDKKNKSWFSTNISGINIHWLPIEYSNYLGYFKRFQVFLKFSVESFFRTIKLRPDLVFATSTPLTVALPAILISRLKDIPMIFETRDLWPDIPVAMRILKNKLLIKIAKFIESQAYKKSKFIVALSPDMKKSIVSKDIDSKKIIVIPNSSDLETLSFDTELANNFRKERSWLKNRPLILYAGAFGLVNDLSYAVYLADTLIRQNSDIRILLVGDGGEKKKIIQMAKKKNVYEKNLFFEEPVSKKNIQKYFSAATIVANFVIDIEANWANSANKFFDGLSAGKPILLNHGGWMKNLVLKYKCGLSMHKKRIDHVAKELDFIVSDKAWLEKSGKASLFLAKNFFNREIHFNQLETVLHYAINNKSELPKELYIDY